MENLFQLTQNQLKSITSYSMCAYSEEFEPLFNYTYQCMETRSFRECSNRNIV